MTEAPLVRLGVNGKPIQRARYSDEFRARCVAEVELLGYPETDGAMAIVAKRRRIPVQTLHRWVTGMNNPPIQLDVIKQKQDLAELLDAIAHQYAEHTLEPALIEKTGALASMTTAAIAIDKLRILQELSNGRMALVRQLFSACAAAGVDVDDTLTRMTARLNALAEERDASMTVLPSDTP